jgi:hypothetical protein
MSVVHFQCGGVSTPSVQFLDRSGQAAFKVFLNFGGKPTAERRPAENTLQGCECWTCARV